MNAANIVILLGVFIFLLFVSRASYAGLQQVTTCDNTGYCSTVIVYVPDIINN